MDDLNENIPGNLQPVVEGLIENLLASEPFVRYNRAQTSLNADREAMKLLKELSAVQAELRKDQAVGTASQQKIARLRVLQAEVQHNPTITAYARAQQAAIESLRAVNQEISQLLGVDFASFIRQPTC